MVLMYNAGWWYRCGRKEAETGDEPCCCWRGLQWTVHSQSQKRQRRSLEATDLPHGRVTVGMTINILGPADSWHGVVRTLLTRRWIWCSI